MELMLFFIGLGLGLLGGGVTAGLWARSRGTAQVAKMEERLASEGQWNQERLQAVQIEREKAEKLLQEREQEMRLYQDQLREEGQRRAGLEAAAERAKMLEVKTATQQEEILNLQKERSDLKARMEEERKASEEKMRLLEEAREKLGDAFKALSAEALKNSNQQFLELAKSNFEKLTTGSKQDLDARSKAIEEMVKPVNENLFKMRNHLAELDKNREGAYKGLMEQVKNLTESQYRLNKETQQLSQALKTPRVRGSWGEMQLKRVVEIAGMRDYCGDFSEQVSANTESGRLRPDMIVHLPDKKAILIDAKAPMESYLNALDMEDEQEKNRLLKDHARQVRDHITQLSSKSYWSEFASQGSLEFVVLFLPGEHFFSLALEYDPSLIEYGVEKKVIPASPTTLIALLRAVAYGWRQADIAENAREISELGKELYERVVTFSGNMSKVGSSLENALTHYNKAVGSLESRLLVSLRRFKEKGISVKGEIDVLKPIDIQPRQLQAADWEKKEEINEEE